jgi:serine protease Do
MTNNPGAAGGALTDHQGRLLGMVGKELRNALNNTWLNYAIPAHELAKTTDEIMAGTFVKSLDEIDKPERPWSLKLTGIVLVPDVLTRTPPYIDAVRGGSLAASTPLQPDDLVMFVNGRLVQTCKALVGELERIDRADPLQLTVVRDTQLIEVQLVAPADQAPVP